MYVYIYIYVYTYINISLEKFKLSINVHACMHACMYVRVDGCMYRKIRNKQGIESNMYTTWDASLQDLCGRSIPWGT